MQQSRRRDPYPFTWEIPAAAAAGVLILAVIGVHVGRGLAVLLGGGWAWPGSEQLLVSIPAVLGGDAGAGLPPAAGADATDVSVGVLLGCVGVAEVGILLLCVAAVVEGLRRWGPNRLRGMATRAQAERLLGISRLRKDRAVVRPDLYGKDRSRTGGARFEPSQVGYRLGRATEPNGGDLFAPWDRTCGVIGPQGSGKTLDLLTPALLGAPGAALVTLTKADDLLLSLQARSRDGRPCLVLDPFGLVRGVPELVWDPIDGCVDPWVAERRAKAFTAGTVKGATQSGADDAAARFYAGEASKVLQAYFHAAALTGRTLDDVLRWVANPAATNEPAEILREHPSAAPMWHGLLQGALNGDDRTAGNTITTIQQALALFFQADIRRRCVPGPDRPATGIAQLIRDGGTIYLLGRDDPYASASPLMTAVTEHVLDTALQVGNTSPWGRLCPPMLACLDELPSTAPLPTLRTRMANERALGISFIWAAQTWRQLAALFGEQEARALIGLSNNLAIFGGAKDAAWLQEVSDLLGTVRITRRSWQSGRMGGRTTSGDDIPVLRPEEIRQLPERHALLIAENAKPILTRLRRCIDGKTGAQLLAQQADARAQLADRHEAVVSPEARRLAAIAEARRRGLAPEETQTR